ncbi:hypothetical protein ScPMuIL_017947 [Solemya velum]
MANETSITRLDYDSDCLPELQNGVVCLCPLFQDELKTCGVISSIGSSVEGLSQCSPLFSSPNRHQVLHKQSCQVASQNEPDTLCTGVSVVKLGG